MDKAHEVEVVSLSEAILKLRVDGRNHVIDLAAVSKSLGEASQEQRERFEISPSGYGIHWPELDEDLSIDGLIGVRHVSPFSNSKASDRQAS